MATEILENLGKAVKTYDVDGAADWAKKAIAEKIDPFRALDALTDAIREVGEAFAREEVYLPELLGAATAMESAMPLLEAEIQAGPGERKSTGTVVAGTVAGDIHSIGKSILCTLLRTEGFEVIDLGIDVPVESFVATAKEQKADIVVMSALLTITAMEQKKVIEALQKEGIRDGIKVLVGGAAISEQFCESIGADGYDATALGGVKLAKDLIGA
jgi:corrinoid protein of di/trimethylamine methyltransferase